MHADIYVYLYISTIFISFKFPDAVRRLFRSEPGVCELFGRKLAELSVESKHELHQGGEFANDAERFERIVRLHGCPNMTLARKFLSPEHKTCHCWKLMELMFVCPPIKLFECNQSSKLKKRFGHIGYLCQHSALWGSGYEDLAGGMGSVKKKDTEGFYETEQAVSSTL